MHLKLLLKKFKKQQKQMVDNWLTLKLLIKLQKCQKFTREELKTVVNETENNSPKNTSPEKDRSLLIVWN